MVRRLVSEIAWIHLPRLQDAIAIREVIEIDGRPTEGERRLGRLLQDPDLDAESEVTSLLDASAGHNLDSGSRNINFPTFPLVYLRERNLNRTAGGWKRATECISSWRSGSVRARRS